MSSRAGDSFDDAYDGFHAFERDMFEWTVVAVAACAEIRAGQPHETELCAVGAAADGVACGGDSDGFDGGAGAFEDFGRFFDDLQHVAVGVLEFELDDAAAGAVLFTKCKRCAAEFFIEIFRDFFEVVLAVLESDLVVVADDVAEGRFGNVALDVGQVVEPFAAFGGGGGFVCGERHRDFGGHEACVFHDAFRFAGMYALAVDFERGAGGIEVLVGDVAFVAAVNGVGVFCLEIAEVQAVGAATDFFVRREADPDVAVAGEVFVAAAFGVAVGFDEFFHGGHDFGDSGLVVCAEERRAVGGDERAALEPLERGEVFYFEDGA